MSGTGQRRKCVTKDRDSEFFWENFDLILSIAKLKAENSKLQAKTIQQSLAPTRVTITRINNVMQKYFYDLKSEQLYLRAQNADEMSRKCLTESELRKIVAENHVTDHRKGGAIYQDLRHYYYPLNRQHVIELTNQL